MPKSRTRQSEFSLAVKKAAYERAGGRCETCGHPFTNISGAVFHHRKALMDGGESSLENCKVLCHYDHAGTEKIFRALHPNSPSRLLFLTKRKKRFYGHK